jgi:hypothetical protein
MGITSNVGDSKEASALGIAGFTHNGTPLYSAVVPGGTPLGTTRAVPGLQRIERSAGGPGTAKAVGTRGFWWDHVVPENVGGRWKKQTTQPVHTGPTPIDSHPTWQKLVGDIIPMIKVG